ncbi:MAG: hypothetical protein ABUS51_05790 [Acidobacteriota bacterium]
MALLIYSALQSGLPPWSAAPFLVLPALLLLFPASSDPLEKIPPERLQTWPLGRWQRGALRLVSLPLSPVFWLAIALHDPRFLALLLGIQFLIRVPRLTAIPRIPLLRGPLGGMITNNLREMFSILDTWVAVLISLTGTTWRLLAPQPDPEALPILGMLTALAMSTYAQSLFGLDLESAETRYRLLPLPASKILFAKDVAFLGILLVLVAPLSPLPAMTFGLVCLAIGHYSSVRLRLPQRRWRFTAGRLLPAGAIQVLAGVMLGFLELRQGSIVFFAVLSFYGLSLNFFPSARVPKTVRSGE